MFTEVLRELMNRPLVRDDTGRLWFHGGHVLAYEDIRRDHCPESYGAISCCAPAHENGDSPSFEHVASATAKEHAGKGPA